ncbi:Glp-like protein [Mycena polygramma]|nr:Glp-like protein [Mycena polygramma]
MVFSIKAATFALLAVAVGNVFAETHTITFNDGCGFGTPTLIQGPNVLSTGGPYSINGPLRGAIAYLQTGGCGLNGEGCTLIETSLVNPTTDGSGSSTDISLIPPSVLRFWDTPAKTDLFLPNHAFSVTSGFGYLNGCQPAGADCNNPNCPTAFHQSGDTGVQVPCQLDNANLVVSIFCLTQSTLTRASQITFCQ